MLKSVILLYHQHFNDDVIHSNFLMIRDGVEDYSYIFVINKYSINIYSKNPKYYHFKLIKQK